MGMVEDVAAQAFTTRWNVMSQEERDTIKATLKDAEAGLHKLNVDLEDNQISGDELNTTLSGILEVFGKPAYRGVMGTILDALGHVGNWWK